MLRLSNSLQGGRSAPYCCLVLLALFLFFWSENGWHPLLFKTTVPTIPDVVSPPSPAKVEPSNPEPRLNTSWHRQIALETANDEAELTAVKTKYGILDRTRVALLMENRPLPYLVPLLLHFLSVVPPEWSFRFMGSDDSIALMESNPTIRRYVTNKKLFLDLIPYEVVKNINSYDGVNYLLTRPWFYEEWIWPSKWLFLFQDDSMICSASTLTLDDFVDEDWSFIGGSAYGNSTPTGTNGGFSLRKVPHLIRMLHTKSLEEFAAEGNPGSEDHYFSTGMWELEGTKMPVGTEAIRFGVVVQYSPVEGEMPLGFHPFSSDGLFRGPEGQANQDKAYKYCPELGIISLGRWDCQCSPNPYKPGGLGG